MPTIYVPDENITLVAEQCYRCGIAFAMPADFKEHRLRDRESFYCPNGHGQVYTGKTEAQKLKDQLAAEKHAREQAEASAKYLSGCVSELHAESTRKDRRINGYKGQLVRVKRRSAQGRCLCCSKQFKDLESHMRAEHPDFDPEKGAEALAEKSAPRGVGA